VPTRTRLLLIVAAAVPLALASGCPQLASDDFTKADEPFDSEGSGGSGSDDDTANSTSFDLSNGTHASSDSNEATASTSQGGTDAASSDDVSSSTDTSANTGGSTSDTGSGGTGGTGGSTSSETSTGGSGGTGGSTSDTGNGGSGGTNGETTSSGCVEAEEVCDGLDNDCDGDADEDYVCDDTSYGCQGFEFGGHGYMYCARPASYEEAAVQCDGQGMTLVQIDSAPENDELVAQASAGWSGGNDGTGGSGSGTTWGGGTRTTGGEEEQEVFWTGGSDDAIEGDWIWIGSGTPFWEGDADGNAVDGAYTNWGEARPNEANDEPENCLGVYIADGVDGDMGTWNDLRCDYAYPFICESPASE